MMQSQTVERATGSRSALLLLLLLAVAPPLLSAACTGKRQAKQRSGGDL